VPEPRRGEKGVARVEIRVEARERKMLPVGRKRKGTRIRESREGEMEFPTDLCAILENYRDLSVKHKFSLI
jgi:hypothetical protein